MNQIRYQAGYKYQLRDSYVHHLPFVVDRIVNQPFFSINGNLLVANSGYAWDGPSGTTVDTPNFMRGSLVHDIFYQCMGEKLLSTEYKELADRELQRICIEDGMSAFRAWYVYEAVHIFGGHHLAGKPTIVAP